MMFMFFNLHFDNKPILINTKNITSVPVFIFTKKVLIKFDVWIQQSEYLKKSDLVMYN